MRVHRSADACVRLALYDDRCGETDPRAIDDESERVKVAVALERVGADAAIAVLCKERGDTACDLSVARTARVKDACDRSHLLKPDVGQMVRAHHRDDDRER